METPTTALGTKGLGLRTRDSLADLLLQTRRDLHIEFFSLGQVLARCREFTQLLSGDCSVIKSRSVFGVPGDGYRIIFNGILVPVEFVEQVTSGEPGSGIIIF